MAWSARDSILAIVVLVLVATMFAAASVPWVLALVLAVAATLVVGVVLARIRWFEHRIEFATAETQSTAELTRILPLRVPLRPMTGWAMTSELGAILVRTVLEKKPKTIVELGSGVSSIVHGYALELIGGGRVYSLDHDAAYADVTRREIALHGLSGSVEVVDAPLVEQRIGSETFHWYSLEKLPADLRIDLLLVDGPPHSTNPIARYPALPLLLSRLSDGAVVVLDDAARSSERAIVERWLNEQGDRLEHVFHATRKGVSTFVVRARDTKEKPSSLV